ncbi:MAG: glycosyltransferase [Chromatiales bacterium]
MNALAVVGLVIGVALLLLPWRPWSTAESLDARTPDAPDLSDITVLVPARNERQMIGKTLTALAAQGAGLRIIVIDDESSDGTAALAEATGIAALEIIGGQPLPAGWTGKLWALEQGRSRVQTPLTALIDADILLAPGLLAELRAKLRQQGLQLVSLMAHLGMKSFWERLLLPAFVYYFKLIYPFALSNSPRSAVAAAAGGCTLLDTSALAGIGGFAALKEALIDDCALAAKIKSAGGRTWIGLTRSAQSQRRYTLAGLWQMVVRSAYTQLRYSPVLLLACTALMTLYYSVPPVALLLSEHPASLIGACGYLLLALPYVPTLRYYDLSPLWAALLPATALLFLAMTWSSALRYYHGERSSWKGRRYQRLS